MKWSQIQPPPGRTIELPGRRTAFVRELAGPAAEGAPALILLHGLMVSADLNWFGAYPALARHFRVLAVDLPGHGRTPAQGRFRLDQCADDVAALAGALGLERVILVGYSMGGLIAQLTWQRHRDLAQGLVLCSTARNFQGAPMERWMSLMLSGLGPWMQLNPLMHLTGSGALGISLIGRLDDQAMDGWARAEMDRTTMATTMTAIDEVSRFSSHAWAGQIDVPAAVIVTTRDTIVPASRQRRRAAVIPAAPVHEIDTGHGVFVHEPSRFEPVLLEACQSVAGLTSRSWPSLIRAESGA